MDKRMEGELRGLVSSLFNLDIKEATAYYSADGAAFVWSDGALVKIYNGEHCDTGFALAAGPFEITVDGRVWRAARYDAPTGDTGSVVKLDGRLDATTAPVWQELLTASAKRGDLTIDMTDLMYLSSAGIRALLIAFKTKRGAYRIKGAAGMVLDVLKTTYMDSVFEMID